MRIFIIGSGNLGIALFRAHNYNGDTVKMSVRNKDSFLGFNVKEMIDFKPDRIYYAAGCGSVDEANKNTYETFKTCVLIPKTILELKSLSGFEFIAFSSQYAERPDLSLYAACKLSLEVLVRNYPNAWAPRVANLIGEYMPEKSLNGKLQANKPKILPRNIVFPTHVDEIAKRCVGNEFKKTKELFKRPGIPLCTYASELLGYRVKAGPKDTNRP